jgi:hypothetical protein
MVKYRRCNYCGVRISRCVLWLTTGSPNPKIIAKIEERPAVENTAPILADSNSQPPIVESEVARESKPKSKAAKIPAQESPKTAGTSPVISDTIQGAMAMKEEAKPENKQSGILDKLDRSKLDDDVSAKKIRSQAAPSAATQMNAKSKKKRRPRVESMPNPAMDGHLLRSICITTSGSLKTP